jgi:hypothetical protein
MQLWGMLKVDRDQKQGAEENICTQESESDRTQQTA